MMSSLRELQAGFRAALLADDERGVAPDVVDDGLSASARLAVYRHHVFTSLTGALDAGGASLEVRRVDDDVVLRALPPATFAFRAALAAGRTLEDAVEQALDTDPAFDLAGEIRALLDERLLVDPQG